MAIRYLSGINVDSNTLFVDSTNNKVGIGISTPSAKLDIDGAHVASIGLLRLNSNAANMSAMTYYIDGVYKAATYAGTDDNFYVWGRDADIVFNTTTSGTTRMVITNGGNVGIGISGPTQKLTVGGSIRVTGGYYDSSNSVGSNGQVLASTGTGTTWINASGGTVNGSGTVNYLSKWTGTTLLGNSLVYDNGTNVGIGNASPAYKLEVSGNVWATDYHIENSAGTGGTFRLDGYQDYLYFYGDSAAIAGYRFGSDVVGIKMQIGTNGNVGIGNTLPSQKLHVDGNIRVTGAYYDSANSAGTSGQILSSTATGTAWINQATGTVTGTGTTNYVSKWTSGTTIGNSSIFDNGNVGISTATPAQKLHVVGGTLLQKGITGTPSWANNTLELNSTGSDSISLEFHRPAYSSTQIWSNGNNLIFGTSSGTERMRIQDGFIGIGTTSPGTALDVNGSIRVTGRTTPSSGNGLEIFYYSSSDCFYLEAYNYTTSAYKTIRYSGASHEFIAGNVGIGLTAPSYKLDVSAAARIYGVRIGRDFSIADRATVRLDSNGNAPADILFGQTAAANQSSWDGVYWSISSRNSGTGAAEGNKFTIWRGGAHSAPYNSESQFITITPDLNLGIGETSPTQKLHVSGNVRVTGAYYDSANAAGTSGQILSSTGTGTAWISAGGGGGIITGSGTTNYVTKWTGSSAVGNSSIYDDGNVGIGTTNPTDKLTIQGTSLKFYTTQNVANQYTYIGTEYSAGNGNNKAEIRFAIDGTDTRTRIQFHTANGGGDIGERMRITYDGNVGIGTTAPSEKLVVSDGGAAGFEWIPSNGRWYRYNRSTSAYGGIYSEASEFTWSPYGSEAMRINGSGKVGIGTSDPIASLDNQGSAGTYRQRGFTTMVTNTLAAAGTQAKRYEIARASIDYNDWNSVGPIEVELYEKYYSRGLKKKYVIYYGYVSASGCNLVEMTGSGDNQFMVSIGPEVVISGDNRYIPIYVDVRYYSQVTAILKTNRGLTTSNPPGIADIWTNSMPTGVDISDFTPDSTVYVGNIIGGNSTFATGNVGVGTITPDNKLTVKGANALVDVQSDGDGQTIGLLARYLNNNALGAGFRYTTGDAQLYIDNFYPGNNGVYSDITIRNCDTGGNLQTRIKIKGSSGNIGIGTTAPSTKLEVGDFLDAVTNKITVAARYEYEPEFNFRLGQSGTNLHWIGAVISSGDDGNYNGKILFKTANAGRDTPTTKMVIRANGYVGIGTTAPNQKLTISQEVTGFNQGIPATSGTTQNGILRLIPGGGFGEAFDFGMNVATTYAWIQPTNYASLAINYNLSLNPNGGNVGIGETVPSQKLHVSGNIRVTGAYYDSANSAGTSGQVLSSTGTGTAWINQGGGTAASLYDLLPAARVAYNWVGQVVNDSWTTVFSKSSNLLTTGTWMVKMYVSDYSVGGQHYTYTYSGMFTWYQDTTNQGGEPAASEIYLHRMGHAANASVLYLRTTETTASSSGDGFFQIKGNYSNTSNQTIQFQFVKIF